MRSSCPVQKHMYPFPRGWTENFSGWTAPSIWCSGGRKRENGQRGWGSSKSHLHPRNGIEGDPQRAGARACDGDGRNIGALSRVGLSHYFMGAACNFFRETIPQIYSRVPDEIHTGSEPGLRRFRGSVPFLLAIRSVASGKFTCRKTICAIRSVCLRAMAKSHIDEFFSRIDCYVRPQIPPLLRRS